MIPDIRGVPWNAPKSMWKMYFSREAIMHFILKCPKFEQFHFRFISRFKTSHVLFFRNAPFFYTKKFWNAPFFPFSKWDRKNGAFQNFLLQKNGAFRKKSTWLSLKREMNRKWNCSNLGHFKIKCIWPHVKNTSFTCFLGHFMIPRVDVKNNLLMIKWYW